MLWNRGQDWKRFFRWCVQSQKQRRRTFLCHQKVSREVQRQVGQRKKVGGGLQTRTTAQTPQLCPTIQSLGGEATPIHPNRALSDQFEWVRRTQPRHPGVCGLQLLGGSAQSSWTPARLQLNSSGHQTREHIHIQWRHLQVGWFWSGSGRQQSKY